jgi:hypothetical protein
MNAKDKIEIVTEILAALYFFSGFYYYFYLNIHSTKIKKPQPKRRK